MRPPRSPLTPRRALLLACALAAVPVLAAVADRYYFEVPRERADRLEGTFDLALGSVSIGEAEPGFVFQAEVTLEESELRPELGLERDGRTAQVRLGFERGKERQGVSWRGFRNRSENEWALYFDRRTPLDLTFSLGLAEADLDFTGFRVERLQVSAGMAPTRLAFGSRNPIEMSELRLDAGATRFSAEGLGNARFRQMRFNGGAGTFDLDFTGGPLPSGARAHLDVGVARLRIRLPEDKAVVLHAPDSWLARVDVPDGYTRRSRGVWHSASVRDVNAAFHLHVNAGVGRVTCETVAASPPPPPPPPRAPRPPRPPR
jgi:hypothetical protein